MIRFRHTALSLGLLAAMSVPAAAWSLPKALPTIEVRGTLRLV